MVLNLKVSQGHYASLKISIIYIYNDEWFRICSCTVGLFCIFRYCVLVFLSIMSTLKCNRVKKPFHGFLPILKLERTADTYEIIFKKCGPVTAVVIA